MRTFDISLPGCDSEFIVVDNIEHVKFEEGILGGKHAKVKMISGQTHNIIGVNKVTDLERIIKSAKCTHKGCTDE